MDASQLVPYRRGIRPAAPGSFPPWVDQELDRAALITDQLVKFIQALEARVAALEP